MRAVDLVLAGIPDHVAAAGIRTRADGGLRGVAEPGTSSTAMPSCGVSGDLGGRVEEVELRTRGWDHAWRVVGWERLVEGTAEFEGRGSCALVVVVVVVRGAGWIDAWSHSRHWIVVGEGRIRAADW